MDYYMDLDAPPNPVMDGRWDLGATVHWKGGRVFWCSRRFVHYFVDAQLRGYSGIDGRHIRNTLYNHIALPLLNANALDFLVAHPWLIPSACRTVYTYFWGTLYKEQKGDWFVRYLAWDERKAAWFHSDTLVDGYGFTSRGAAALYLGILPSP